jgi:hypothetical protein
VSRQAIPIGSEGGAPANHSHPTSEVTGLDAALSGKAATSHSHVIADTTGLQVALDGKATTGHTHASTWVQLTQAQYDALTPKNPSTLYVIVG